MFKKNLNNDWLASSEEKAGKKNDKKNLIWFVIKELIHFGCYICKILEFFSRNSP